MEFAYLIFLILIIFKQLIGSGFEQKYRIFWISSSSRADTAKQKFFDEVYQQVIELQNENSRHYIEQKGLLVVLI